MKNLSDIFEAMSAEELCAIYSEEPPVDDVTAKVINYIFLRMQGFIPAFKYSADSQQSLDSMKREWCYAIKASNVTTIEKINAGLNKLKARGDKFIPTVSDFIAMCTPTAEDLGLPTVMECFRVASNNSHPSVIEKNWSRYHPAIYHMWKMTGSSEFQKTQTEVFLTFERNYDATVRMLINGELLTDIPLGIENKKTDANYQEYWGEFKRQQDFGLRPKTDKILTRYEWDREPDPK